MLKPLGRQTHTQHLDQDFCVGQLLLRLHDLFSRDLKWKYEGANMTKK